MFASISALTGGYLVDRVGPRLVFAAGGAAYVLGYVGFALPLHAWPLLLVAFALAGTGIGLGETAQSAAVALLLSDRLRAAGFGVLGLVQSLGDLVASVGGGVIWAEVGPAVAFGYAAGWMALSVAAGALLATRAPTRELTAGVSRAT